ncbi:sel1 repeat family protein [Mangrovicella endophytica]|uniref:sel1 repeat family protein n=1 Tax=Mangrovicella endophytica TaxID=2066697 RepID=UPI001FE073B4|nr:sel1 repeat family protein [Mangrovicella endophytica]
MSLFERIDTAAAATAPAGLIAADVLFEMGMRLAAGRDGAVDLVAAHMYFNLADQKGAERAAFYRQEMADQMSKSEIAKALRAAREWLTLH